MTALVNYIGSFIPNFAAECEIDSSSPSQNRYLLIFCFPFVGVFARTYTPRLRDASDAERQDWRFIGNGIGVHWSKVDEDISVKALMRGID